MADFTAGLTETTKFIPKPKRAESLMQGYCGHTPQLTGCLATHLTFELQSGHTDYILAHFIDREYGGAYLSLKADGTPSNTRKQVYTNAFFIYALSEYSRATGDKQALAEARKIFDLFEKHAADKESSGYFEVFSREWERIRERMIGESSEKDEKTMNTSLHVMEAFANLYRVSGDKVVGDRLRNMIEIFLDKIIDKKSSHLICFLDRNWNGTSTVDSYGHDIECSWLLYEAAVLLNDSELDRKGENSRNQDSKCSCRRVADRRKHAHRKR